MNDKNKNVASISPAESERTSVNFRGEPNNILEINGSRDDEDYTCCHRATFCNPVLREINVTKAICKCMGLEITWADLFWLVTCTVLIFMVWCFMYFVLGPTMLPGGNAFGLCFLVVFSYALGWLLTYIPYLSFPPVFGMLLAGIIVRNANLYNIHDQLGAGPTAKIRAICLTFIMIRAGLQLTTTALREHPFVVVFMGFLPCSLETLIVSCCSIYILHYPVDWAFLTGSIVACISPVVTMNCMLTMAEEGYGEDKGMTSLLYASSSIESAHLMLIFSICFSIVFTSEKNDKKYWWSSVPTGLREVSFFFIGMVVGLVLAFFPHRKHRYVNHFRMVGLVAGSLMCTTGASVMQATGGGFLATLFLSFIAITGWRILSVSYDAEPLQKAAAFIWHFIQPILVGVIGADIDLHLWSVKRFGLHVICIFAGLTIRVLCVFLSTYKTKFSLKERVFMALAWLPKGTIQAALAPMAYERARKEDDPHIMELAIDVVRISVLSIVFLAPLGAFLVMRTARSLLNKIDEDYMEKARKLSYLRIMALQPVRNANDTNIVNRIVNFNRRDTAV